MAERIRFDREGNPDGDLRALARLVAGARKVVALTGAGVSVESGIPDFRSPGGLWTVFDPSEYATLSCFVSTPEKAWELYRALGASIEGRAPNPAHVALARLEAAGLLAGIVTQNIDGLHQAAGSRTVAEIHGDGRRLECPGCGRVEPMLPVHLEPGPPPRCRRCGRIQKPAVVLFGERVRDLERVAALVAGSDLMLVAGTSAEVAPASHLPGDVIEAGGSVVELNRSETRLTEEGLGPSGWFVEGSVGITLPALAAAVLADDGGGTG